MQYNAWGPILQYLYYNQLLAISVEDEKNVTEK
jgi:hypothetical protein